jgi:hypothetical protein
MHVLLTGPFMRHFLYRGSDIKKVFAALRDTAPWTDPSNLDLLYHGHELARRKAFLVVSAASVPRLPSVIPLQLPPAFNTAACSHTATCAPSLSCITRSRRLAKQLGYENWTFVPMPTETRSIQGSHCGFVAVSDAEVT